jgi:hypothetical protein
MFETVEELGGGKLRQSGYFVEETICAFEPVEYCLRGFNVPLENSLPSTMRSESSL